MFFSLSAWADAPWSSAQAKDESERAIGEIINAQSLLKFAIQAKDKRGWDNLVIREIDKRMQDFRTQRFVLNNKNVQRYVDCEDALEAYKFYSATFFQPDTMMSLQSRDVNGDDFKKYFKSCKKSAGWSGK